MGVQSQSDLKESSQTIHVLNRFHDMINSDDTTDTVSCGEPSKHEGADQEVLLTNN